ncbi:MAG: hypothetical protein ABSC25_21450 [Roseiarcus sp.]|jgi:hypothetical protein
MRGKPGFFDDDGRLEALSDRGSDLAAAERYVDFEIVRADLERAVPRDGQSEGGRPHYDHVPMSKVRSFIRFIGLT